LLVVLLHGGQNIGACCADFSPLVILLSFSLDSNSFGDETGKALAQALTTNTTLTRLEYGGGGCRGCFFACRRLHVFCCLFGGKTSGSAVLTPPPLVVLLSFSLENNNLNTATKDAIEKAWGNRKGNVYV